MKIDFLAPYKEVARATPGTRSAQGTKRVNGDSFAQLLADIAPLQNAKTLIHSGGSSRGSGSPETSSLDSVAELVARLGLPQPEPKFPAVERRESPGSEVRIVNEAPKGVKTTAIETPPESTEVHPTPKQDSHESSVGFVAKLLRGAADKHGIDPVLGLAVVETESSFNPRAVSTDGHESKGLFQLLDKTAQHLLSQLGSKATYDPFNPEMNVDLGVGYLRYLHDLFSRDSELNNKVTTKAAANSSSLEKLAVAAFNAGEGRVAAAQSRAERDGKNPAQYEQVAAYLPESTQEYVQRIIAAKARYEGSVFG